MDGAVDPGAVDALLSFVGLVAAVEGALLGIFGG